MRVEPVPSSRRRPADDGTRAGRLVDRRYRLVRRLTPGGMGDVWLAEHTRLSVPVVVKFFARAGSTSTYKAVERFRMEARLGAQFAERTRHVVVVHDFGDDEGRPYLVTEYVRGRSLEEELRDGPMRPARFARVLHQICSALGVVHSCGFVHRDVTPSNVLLTMTRDGSFDAKLADFGATQPAEPAPVGKPLPDRVRGEIVGTPGYMSPEQLFGADVDARADVWALGAIAYRALTGTTPFAGTAIVECVDDMLTQRLDPAVSLRADLPRALDAWFECALAKPRALRFGSAGDMSRAFDAAILAETDETPGAMSAPR